MFYEEQTELDDLFVDGYGNGLPGKCITLKRSAKGKVGQYVKWWEVPVVGCRPEEINETLDLLDGMAFKVISPQEGARNITKVSDLRNAYYLTIKGNQVIISGVRDYGEYQYQVFRYSAHKGEAEATSIIFKAFDSYFREYTGTTHTAAFGELPQEFHQYRRIVPNQIDWVNPLEVVDRRGDRPHTNMNKADVSSAYGYELTKVLPNMNDYKVAEGRVEPSEEYPFAFYLTSGNMAIWNEGSTWDYNELREFKRIKEMSLGITRPDKNNENDIFTGKWKDQDPARDRTLLCGGIKVEGLEEMINFLYDDRKVHPINKEIMNIRIGGWWSRKTHNVNGYPIPVMWPLTAVIHFRCNARIAKWVDKLKELEQFPILINTDSISWKGDDISICEEKKLGALTLEYKNCEMMFGSVKSYQINYFNEEIGDYECITRWSGVRKLYSSQLPFGAVANEKYLGKFFRSKLKSMYTWDAEKCRYVDGNGDIYVGGDMNAET